MPSQSSVMLVLAVAGAALFAAFRTESVPATRVVEREQGAAESFEPPTSGGEDDVLPPDHPPIGAGAPFEGMNGASESDVLPPDHPPIGGNDVAPGFAAGESDAPPAIAWTAPAKWTVLPNPNSMRLATYRIPAAAGAPDEAELSVVSAGGSTEANLQRWVDQFADAEPARRAQKVVHGLKVSTLEVSGTFKAGAMGAPGDAPVRRGWMLEGAVVETDQGTYFFKLTGPAASVRAARADFDAVVDGLTPTASAAPH